MKLNTNQEISFTNASGGFHLNKEEGAIAVDFKSSEMVLYLNTSLYQGLAWLLVEANETEELMKYVNWNADPSEKTKKVIEVHGPGHSVCLVCSPKHERVQLNFEIGVSLDIRYNDFKGLIELAKEAQSDLDWRRELLKFGYTKENHDFHSKDNKKIG